jgi:hypothetical protein
MFYQVLMIFYQEKGIVFDVLKTTFVCPLAPGCGNPKTVFQTE